MIRNFIDYQNYLFQINRKETITTIVDLVIFVSSLGVLFSNWGETFRNIPQNWFLIIVLIGSLIKFSYDVYNMIEKIRGYLDLRYGEIFQGKINFKEMKTSRIERDLGYEIIECKINDSESDYALNSPKIDEYIAKNQLIIEEAKNKEKAIINFIRTEKENILRF